MRYEFERYPLDHTVATILRDGTVTLVVKSNAGESKTFKGQAGAAALTELEATFFGWEGVPESSGDIVPDGPINLVEYGGRKVMFSGGPRSAPEAIAAKIKIEQVALAATQPMK